MNIEELKKIIGELPDSEAKSLLFQIYLRLNLVKGTEYSETDFVNDVKRIYDAISRVSISRSEESQVKKYQKVHILYDDSSAGSFKVTLKNLDVNKVENIISFSEMFSIGPVWRLHEQSGEEIRMDWMRKVTNDEYSDFQSYRESFHKTVHEISTIPDDVPITIWVGDNSHEQTGLRYVLHLLRNKTNEIKVINTSKMFVELFNTPDVQYMVLKTGEISPEKLQVIYEQSITIPPLSQEQRMVLEQEWLALSEHRDNLRIWEDEKIVSVSEDYYDPFIIEMAEYLHSQQEVKSFMRSARVIGQVLGNLDQCIGDSFFEYRLRELIKKGVFEFEGSLRAMRYYSVALK